MPKKRPTGQAIRQTTLRDLTEHSQVSELNRMLREVIEASRKTPMNVETPAARGGENDERRLRVVDNSTAKPGETGFGEQEFHANVGGKWRRLMLEDL